MGGKVVDRSTRCTCMATGNAIMSGSESDFVIIEKYRHWLRLLGELQVDRRLKGKVDLSGVVQQTLYEAYQARADWCDQPSDQRLAYLRKVLAHNLSDEVRKLRTGKRDARREQPLQVAIDQSSMPLDAWLAAESSSPSHHMQQEERALQLAEALDRLPAAQREALVMQNWQGCTLAEIAESMGRTRAAVAGLLKRGLQQLREQLRDG
jgi:RNA polymerase sigma-70 factor, ECF subfamily